MIKVLTLMALGLGNMSQQANAVPLRRIMSQCPSVPCLMTDDHVSQLLLRKDMNHLLLSDVLDVLQSL